MQVDMPCFDTMNPHVAQHSVWDVLETLAPPGEDNAAQQQTRDLAAAAMLESFKPGTVFETMLACQIVAAHHSALGCFRWAMQTESASVAASRLRRDAIAMNRTLLTSGLALFRIQESRIAAERGAVPTASSMQDSTPGGAPLPPDAAPAAAPAPNDVAPPAGPPEDAAPPLVLTKRERGKTDWHSTRAALRLLEGRDPRTLTDDELEARLKAKATPEHPYDPSWREIKPLPHHPYWEELTPEERRARYGWRSEEEIEAEKAAAAALEAAAEADADADADQPPPGPPRPK